MKNSKYAVGLMSGTSLDGIDAALVKITDHGIKTKAELIDFICLDLSENIKNKIKACCSISDSNTEVICSLNFELGYIFAEAVKKVCYKANFDINKLDFIGSHGQTIYHLPKSKDELFKSTLQIGEAAVIAYETNCQVVSNFRTMDMAAEGEGAPLVPYTDYILFKGDKGRALQNIGGIGNVTVIPKECSLQNVYAFDTGPGNMIIDEVTKKLMDLPYDKNGEFASRGKIIDDILNTLMEIEYIKCEPPKTTGRELFGAQFVDKLLVKYPDVKPEDLIATITMFTAKSIEWNYRNYIFNKDKIDEIIITGGGSYNKTLVSNIKQLIPECRVMTGEEFGISSEAKEAVAFAILANETLNGNFSNVKGATGAKENVILGNITPKPRRL
jgi:anhydro-N-acetylmuramic acid kinase